MPLPLMAPVSKKADDDQVKVRVKYQPLRDEKRVTYRQCLAIFFCCELSPCTSFDSVWIIFSIGTH